MIIVFNKKTDEILEIINSVNLSSDENGNHIIPNVTAISNGFMVSITGVITGISGSNYVETFKVYQESNPDLHGVIEVDYFEHEYHKIVNGKKVDKTLKEILQWRIDKNIISLQPNQKLIEEGIVNKSLEEQLQEGILTEETYIIELEKYRDNIRNKIINFANVRSKSIIMSWYSDPTINSFTKKDLLARKYLEDISIKNDNSFNLILYEVAALYGSNYTDENILELCNKIVSISDIYSKFTGEQTAIISNYIRNIYSSNSLYLDQIYNEFVTEYESILIYYFPEGKG